MRAELDTVTEDSAIYAMPRALGFQLFDLAATDQPTLVVGCRSDEEIAAKDAKDAKDAKKRD